MTDPGTQDITTQILIQIRDEMRDMRASFERRFDALERRLDSLEARMDALEARMDTFEARMDAFEARMDASDGKSDKRFQELLRRFGLLDADLKKFASVTNAAILHYAEEMDKVRDRLAIIEEKLDIPQAP